MLRDLNTPVYLVTFCSPEDVSGVVNPHHGIVSAQIEAVTQFTIDFFICYVCSHGKTDLGISVFELGFVLVPIFVPNAVKHQEFYPDVHLASTSFMASWNPRKYSNSRASIFGAGAGSIVGDTGFPFVYKYSKLGM